jgi:hypothetical protein
MSSTDKPAARPERLMQFAFGYAPPLMIESAIRLRAFDALADGPKSLDELAAATGASARGLRLLLNALVGLELLAKDARGKYALTPESEKYLVSGKHGYLGGFFAHSSGTLIPKWLHLTEVVRTGKPAMAVNQQGDGAAFFETFVEDLFPVNYPAAKALGESLGVAKLDRPFSVLDLAAGSGVWGIAVADLSPRVTVTAVDWPGVLPVTRRVADRHGLGDRVRLVAGDLASADFGTGHDLATLGHILHSEGEARSRSLLRKTFAALAPGGTVAVAEWLVNEERTGPPAGLIFGVNMLVNTDEGDTFSFGEIGGWLREAGFKDVRQLEVPGPSPLILATK